MQLSLRKCKPEVISSGMRVPPVVIPAYAVLRGAGQSGPRTGVQCCLLNRFPSPYTVTPAKAGGQERLRIPRIAGLDSGLRRNDEANDSSKPRILDKRRAV
jgi:hypothetical protein